MMNCQVALHTKLKHLGEYAEIDLAYSLRPWPRIIAANEKPKAHITWSEHCTNAWFISLSM